MKRISLWVLSTVSVVVLLFGYDASSTTTAGTTPLPIVSGAGSPADTPGTTGASDTSGATTQPSTTTKKKQKKATTRTVTGDTASTRWGPVQVELTVTGQKITAVGVLQYPNGNPRDQEINSYALPILIQETTQQQSANIDMVSGATVTSDGYVRSLQSAIDRANL